MIAGLESGVSQLFVDGQHGAVVVGEHPRALDHHLVGRHGRRIDSGRRSIARGDLFAALHTGAFAALDDVPVIGDQDDGATDGRGGGHQRVEPLEPVDPPHGADRIGAVEGVVDVVEDARDDRTPVGVVDGRTHLDRQRATAADGFEVGLVEEHLSLTAQTVTGQPRGEAVPLLGLPAARQDAGQ